MKRLLVLSLCSLLIGSCSTTTFYQLLETKGLKGNTTTFEDENCIISYDFWGENGNSGFTLTNKSSNNIYVDLNKCFFNLNNYVYDYYRNREFSYSNSVGVSNNVSKAVTGINNFGYIQQNKAGAGSSFSAGKATTYIEKDIVCVPPSKMRYFSEYNIASIPFKYCDMKKFPVNNSKKIKSIDFETTNSPITFGNIIAYRTDGNNKEKVIENQFYLSKITNYPSSLFKTKQAKDRCPDDAAIYSDYEYIYNFYALNNFFIKYSSTNTKWVENFTKINKENKLSVDSKPTNVTGFYKITSKPEVGETVYFENLTGNKIKAEVLSHLSSNGFVNIKYINKSGKTKTKNIAISWLYRKN